MAYAFTWEEGAWKCLACGARVEQGTVDEHTCEQGESEDELIIARINVESTDISNVEKDNE